MQVDKYGNARLIDREAAKAAAAEAKAAREAEAAEAKARLDAAVDAEIARRKKAGAL